MARVFDENDEIVDESVWNAARGISATAERLARLSAGRLTEEARVLAERFPDAVRIQPHDLSKDEWPALDDAELRLLQQATLIIAQRGVADAAGDPDRRLEHLVRAGDELRTSWTTIEARLVEWAGMFLPELDLDASRSRMPAAIATADALSNAAETLETTAADSEISDSEWIALRGWAQSVVEVESRLSEVEEATRRLASSHLPSTSALLGPLLAARMATAAHGRGRLARLPSGTIQVLGAETSFFLHLSTGIPSPKHGFLFGHPWVSRSPRWVRGKIARMLSGKVAICARLDAFDGESWTDADVAQVANKVESIRQRHPKPSSKR